MFKQLFDVLTILNEDNCLTEKGKEYMETTRIINKVVIPNAIKEEKKQTRKKKKKQDIKQKLSSLHPTKGGV